MRSATLLGTSAAVAAAAVAGGLAARDVQGDPWYRSLSKPAIQPPPAAFPIVWTALYADLAVASADVIDTLQRDSRTAQASAFRRALGANLLVNASWSWVFFRSRRLGLAPVVAGVLAVSSADLARRASTANRRAATGLGVYAGWCAFATVLSAAVWRRNRG
jgi:tryptophan-rich sensory protein